MSTQNNKALDRKKSSNRTVVLILSLAIITGIAYSNSFSGVFLFDDGLAIVDNPWIRSIGSPGDLFSVLPPGPVITVTLAINYGHGGMDPFGYHAVNLLIPLDPASSEANYSDPPRIPFGDPNYSALKGQS